MGDSFSGKGKRDTFRMRIKIVLFLLILWVISVRGQVLISLLLGDKLNTGQVEFGLEGGYNWATITGMEANDVFSTFNLGFYFFIRVNHPWYIYTGVLVRAQLGVDNLSANDLAFLGTEMYDHQGEYSQHVKTFLIPILIQYRYKNFFIETGPQFGLTHGTWVEFSYGDGKKEARIREFNQDLINRVDFGGMVGFGYKIPKKNGMSFAIKYYLGFRDVYKIRPGTHNRAIFLTITVPIGAK